VNLVSGTDRVSQGFPNTGSGSAPNDERRLKDELKAEMRGERAMEEGLELERRQAQTRKAAVTGAAVGAGVAIGGAVAKPISGIKGIFLNIIPENIFGVYVAAILFVYWFSFQASFEVSIVYPLHILLGIGGFLVYAVNNDGLDVLTKVRKYAPLFLALILADYMLLTGQLNITLAAITIMAFAVKSEGGILENVKSIVMWFGGAAAAFYFYLQFESLIFSSIANIGPVFSIISLITNRTLTFPFFWFAMIKLGEKTRVARSLIWIVVTVLILANWGNLQVLAIDYKDTLGDLTQEQEEVVPNVIQTAAANLRNGVSSLFSGRWLQGPAAEVFEEFEQIYGFGQAKKEPEVGIKLKSDPNMPSVFNLDFVRNPSPSAIIEIPNPLPVGSEKTIQLTEIVCDSKDEHSEAVVTKPIIGEDPVIIAYKRPRTVACEFTGMGNGKKTAEITIKYEISTNAELSTAFMRNDQINALLKAGEDPAVANRIPPARAEYDNGPIAITFGPVELVTSPVGINAGGDDSSNSIVVYAAKSKNWDGEINGIKKLELSVPDGVILKEGVGCSFKKKPGTNIYEVDPKIVRKDGGDGDLRFVGDGIPFECGISSDSTVLGGLDWVGAEFRVSAVFVFSTKKNIRFDITGAESDEVDSPVTPASTEPEPETTTPENVEGIEAPPGAPVQ
jgi:hypothetical protein